MENNKSKKGMEADYKMFYLRKQECSNCSKPTRIVIVSTHFGKACPQCYEGERLFLYEILIDLISHTTKKQHLFNEELSNLKSSSVDKFIDELIPAHYDNSYNGDYIDEVNQILNCHKNTIENRIISKIF